MICTFKMFTGYASVQLWFSGCISDLTLLSTSQLKPKIILYVSFEDHVYIALLRYLTHLSLQLCKASLQCFSQWRHSKQYILIIVQIMFFSCSFSLSFSVSVNFHENFQRVGFQTRNYQLDFGIIGIQ